MHRLSTSAVTESPSTDHVALSINYQQLPVSPPTPTPQHPSCEHQDETTSGPATFFEPKDKSTGIEHAVVPVAEPCDVVVVVPPPHSDDPSIDPSPIDLAVSSPIAQRVADIWSAYDASVDAPPPEARAANSSGLASGLHQLRTGLQIFDTLLHVGVQPSLFSSNSTATVDAYVLTCPRAAAPLIGTATTQALNSCDAVDKAAREVNSWCMVAESFLGFAIEAVRDDNLTNATSVTVALCRSGVDVMRTVATAMQSCIESLKVTAATYKDLAALHESNATTKALTTRNLFMMSPSQRASKGSEWQSEHDDVEWAKALQCHVRRMDKLVGRIHEALKALQTLRVIEALEAYLERPVSLETLDRTTLQELATTSSNLLEECAKYQHKHRERVNMGREY